jgi:hypothetical protein
MRALISIMFILALGAGVMAQDTIPALEEPVAIQEQAVEKPPLPAWKDKIYYGGYVNFSLGSYTAIGIEPMVGYKLIPRLSVGVKFRYDYISDNRFSETYHYSNYGGSLFARLNLFKWIYLHAEYAGYNYQRYDELGEKDRVWVPYLFLGGGLRQPIGKRTSLNAQILFDVLQDSNSPYKKWEPFYSVGVSVGF